MFHEGAGTPAQLLRSAGIECGHRATEETDSLLEEFSAEGPQEILVHASDLEAAKELLAASQEPGE